MEGETQEAPKAAPVELKTPYCNVFMELAKKEIPQNADSMRIILEDVDRQAVDNFNLFKSEKFPGTEISFIKLSVTPDLIRRIARTGQVHNANVNSENGTEIAAKNEVAFLFTAIGMPPDGNAFTAQDMGIDRFIRSIPKVARAMKAGEAVPNVDIYLLGSGTGYGEKVSKDFVQQVKNKGIEVRSELYAELIQQMLQGRDLNQTRVLLQGVSMGTVSADQTYARLPEDIKKVSQRLFDNPAGTHRKGNVLAGFQATAGLIGEGLVRNTFDPAAKILNSKRLEFAKYLLEKKGVSPDTKEDKWVKSDLFKVTVGKLLKGVPLNLKDRAFIRKGVKDPLTTDFRFGKTKWEKKENSLQHPSNKTHIFIYENFPRFNQVINYCKTVSA